MADFWNVGKGQGHEVKIIWFPVFRQKGLSTRNTYMNYISPIINSVKVKGKNQGLFVKHYAPGGNKVQKAIFSFKVKVDVIRSLTLVSFERVSFVEYECQIPGMKFLSLMVQVIAKVKVDNRQTNKQTGQKQYAPDHSIQGHKNQGVFVKHYIYCMTPAAAATKSKRLSLASKSQGHWLSCHLKGFQ